MCRWCRTLAQNDSIFGAHIIEDTKKKHTYIKKQQQTCVFCLFLMVVSNHYNRYTNIHSVQQIACLCHRTCVCTYTYIYS